MAQELQLQLRDVGSKLASPPASKDVLIKLLKQAANCLSELDQSPSPQMLDSMKPCLDAIAKQDLLKHQDKDVKVLVATCICEITRITAPEAPYNDDILREIFHLIVGILSGLNDINSPSFGRRVVILEMLARYRSCVMMLDLECDDLIEEMFTTCFSVISDDHPKTVLLSMQKIMVLILDESEDIQENLLSTILSPLGRKKSDFSVASRRLAMDVIGHCAGKLEPSVKQFLVSSLSGDVSSLNDSIDYHEVIYDIYQCAPQMLSGIVPYITAVLLADSLDVRLKAVHLLGELFALRGVSISESFQPLFSEFLKRLTDRAVEVRVSVIEHLKNYLLSNPTHPEVPLIIKALSDRLLDYDENVRKQVVAAIYDVACDSVKVIPVETARLVAERLRDKSQSVKRYTMKRLADLYRFYCLKSTDGSMSADEYEWIPGKILRCLYDKDFRSESIELILCGFLFPPEFSIKDRLKHWATVISGFDKVEVKALEQILLQKQRLQQEMQKYLSLRQKYQEDASELQKRTTVCFRNMSRLFSDVAKVGEGFQVLNQLKDVNIWKLLTALLDSCTSFQQSWSYRDDLLKILGDKHPLYDFMSALSIKCSYLLFNKDYVKEILLEASAQKSNGHVKFISSCMNLLAIIACFSPQLLLGSEETLVDLLKEDNEIIKEGIAHVLAKAGGAIREQLAKTSSSVDLLLERLCLEGSRKQAKYSVQAIAAITKDDGLKSLSVLYKRLVDNLDEKTHLPAILQSLGCIAQCAMPVFETREDEIVGFIKQKVLERSNKTGGVSTHPTEWNERTELCLLKIFGIKTLVKSYLPVRDAHLRPEIDKVVGILKNVLSFGDFSKDIESSVVDKAHMRLAAAKAVLRLSRQWDHKIPVDVLYMTLRVSEDAYAQSRKLFLSKVHQYIKERLLDAKYACAFLLSINQHHSPEYNEGKHNLLEVVQICQQVKMRQLSLQTDGSSTTTYPEYLLAYLVHVLAHHPSCPNINESKDVKDFEPIYCRLHLFLSLLLHGDEGGPNKKKERLTCLVSILQSIKCSEDVVDRTKSKTSHAICDLGLSIMKRLVPEQIDISGTANPISLPPTLYKSVENSEGERSMENGEQTLLDGDTIVAHFEALMFEDKELILSGEAEDEMVIEEKDGDGNEVPLGKMMKMLKAQGMKKKKNLKNHNISSNTKTSENEVDILGVVREINLDNMKEDWSMEIGNLSSDHDHFEGEPSPSQLIKGTNSTSMLSVSTPKRKRSACSQRSHSNSAKGQKQSGDMSISHSIKTVGKAQGRKLFKGTNESTDSDLLVSCLPTIKSMLSWSDKKDAEGSKSGAISNPMKSPNLAGTAKEVGGTRSSSGSSRKRKVRRVSGLTKCSSHSAQGGEGLIGSRIKVWWPLDKVYYEGIVRSYDPEKKKHEVLYDDGEVEFLCLDKEEWELITKSNMSKKRPKYHHRSLNAELSTEKTNKKKVHGFSKDDKDSPKKIRRRTVSKKNIDRNGRKASENGINVDESDIDGRGDSDLSGVPPHSGSEIHNANSDVSEGRHTAPQLETEEQTETNAVEMAEEPLEEVKPDPSTEHCDGDSDDEPLNTWKIRAGNTV
ncbi:sister chromatid cohesion protein PDS5-like protein A [Iris pallida]|uniref:Sister chromatid cohesion protein PDS5-like protein A n=1 Tax=Iris pallida TaxID=29817 RepID=A0AAX6FE67_IRIPA|nr:sister chromatid cohesion protein PDS5-like protein A [Iris pallida]